MFYIIGIPKSSHSRNERYVSSDNRRKKMQDFRSLDNLCLENKSSGQVPLNTRILKFMFFSSLVLNVPVS